MFFDNLAGIVERHLPEFVPMLKQARIFRLEGRLIVADSVGEIIEAWEPDERTIENFRLPFREVALEAVEGRGGFGRSCAVLSATDDLARRLDFVIGYGSRQETYVGAGSVVAFPNLEQLIVPSAYERYVEIKSLRIWEGTKKGLTQLESRLHWIVPGYDRVGRLQSGNIVERAIARVARHEDLIDAWKNDPDFKKLSPDSVHEHFCKMLTNLFNLHAIVAVLGVLTINEPASFVVEERPLRPTGDNPNNAIPRSAGRPHFIVLKPKQIRERFIYPAGVEGMEDDEAERRKVTPHERRGHFRRLQADRFVNARGQVIWIKPMWVGPSEAVRGPNQYRVRLDL